MIFSWIILHHEYVITNRSVIKRTALSVRLIIVLCIFFYIECTVLSISLYNFFFHTKEWFDDERLIADFREYFRAKFPLSPSAFLGQGESGFM